MNNIILIKESSENEILAYFEGVRNLVKNNEEFPVSLDEVWMLAYPRKDHAVRTLRKDFIEGEDYIVSQVSDNQLIPTNEENKKGRKPTTVYYLSVSCVEYFIARKVRPVFDVYRKVFHKTADMFEKKEQLSGAEYLLQQAQLMVEQERRLKSIENRLNNMEKEREENSIKLLSIEISHNKLPEQSLRSKVNELVRTYSTATNTPFRGVWHLVYKKLYNLYHISINAYKRKGKETKLDIAERNHFLDKIYDIVSDMARTSQVK